MAKAKATPAPQAKLEPKQIVLTEEQYSELISIYDVMNEVTDQISDLADTELTQIQLGYNLGMINSELQSAFNKLDNLTDAINPAIDNSWWDDSDDEVTDEDEN
jgi:hypothetical protein